MPALNPDHLLDQADRLVAPPARGAARQADLRRAISNAYYAVFHAVVTEAADRFAGRSRSQRQGPLYRTIYRGIEHNRLRKLCDEFANSKGKDKDKLSDQMKRCLEYAPRGAFGPEWEDWARSVAGLYQKRMEADYDPKLRVSPSDAVLAVRLARTAVAQFRAADGATRNAFVALLVFPPTAR